MATRKKRNPGKRRSPKAPLILLALGCALLCLVLTGAILSSRRSGKNDAESRTETEERSGGTSDASGEPESDPASDSQPEVSVPEALPLAGKRILLDPGHGFGDVGCAFPFQPGLWEKDVTPVLVKKLRAELESRGAEVLLTHDGEKFPSFAELSARNGRLGYDLDGFLTGLASEYSGRDADGVREIVAAFRAGLADNDLFSPYERCWYANLLSLEKRIDLYLSVHVNASETSAGLNGFELYFCPDTPFADPSGKAADAIGKSLAAGFPGRRLVSRAYGWEDAFVVNKYVSMPSLLLETGYATNPADASDLLREEWQDALARSVADGIEAAFSPGLRPETKNPGA